MVTINTGSVLASHWGYEAHLTDFYLVKKRTPKMVKLVRLEKCEFNHRGMEGWEVEPLTPLQEKGKPFRRRVWYFPTPPEDLKDEDVDDYFEYVYINDWERAQLWDGKPVSNFDWH